MSLPQDVWNYGLLIIQKKKMWTPIFDCLVCNVIEICVSLRETLINLNRLEFGSTHILTYWDIRTVADLFPNWEGLWVIWWTETNAGVRMKGQIRVVLSLGILCALFFQVKGYNMTFYLKDYVESDSFTQLVRDKDIDSKCGDHVTKWLRGLEKGEMWALRSKYT